MKDVNDSNTWSVKVPVFFALIGLFGGFVAWGTMTRIAGAIISPGRIEVDQNRQVVQHQMGGTVAQILVVEGDIVKAGDVLLRLDDQQLQSQLAITEEQLFELMARRGRLSAERDSVDTVTFDDVLISVGTANPDISELLKVRPTCSLHDAIPLCVKPNNWASGRPRSAIRLLGLMHKKHHLPGSWS
jgi:multidrug efflux pump subunit AcrA (membrane-fusion protein)